MTTVLDNSKHDDMDQRAPEADDGPPSQDPGPADAKTDPAPATEDRPKAKRTRGARKAHANGSANGTHANGAATDKPSTYEDTLESRVTELIDQIRARRSHIDKEQEADRLEFERRTSGRSQRKARLDAQLAKLGIAVEAEPAAAHQGTPAPKRAARPAKKTAAAARKAAPANKAAPTKVKSDRLPRRSPEELKAGVEKIRAHLKKAGPQNAETIKRALGFDVREMPGLLKLAIASKALAKSGEKRATIYRIK